MSDWTRAALIDCLQEVATGEWGTDPGAANENVLVVRSTNLDDEGHLELSTAAPRRVPARVRNAKRLRRGDIVVEASGGGPARPVGRVARFPASEAPADCTFLGSNFMRILRPASHVDPAFLAWCLLHLHKQPKILHFQQQTTGIINLKVSEYLRHELALPPLPEQQRIAEILDTLDEAIRKTEEVIAKLQQVKQGLLHDLLTRGIDEHGELRDPNRHPEQFKDSELGRVPRSWQLSTVGDHLQRIEAGSSPSCPDTPAPPGHWGVLKVSAVRPDGLDPNENKVIERSGLVDRSAEVQHGDVLMTRANTRELVGMACFVIHPRPKLMLCDKTLRLVVGGSSDARFLARSLRMSYIRRQIEAHATGSSGSMKNISQAAIRRLIYLAPPKAEQERIAAALEEADVTAQQEMREREKFCSLRSALTHDLLTGRVRVPAP